jgi:hypothetical protein
MVFSPPFCQGVFHGPLGEVILPGANGHPNPEEGFILPASLGEGPSSKTLPPLCLSCHLEMGGDGWKSVKTLPWSIGQNL